MNMLIRKPLVWTPAIVMGLLFLSYGMVSANEAEFQLPSVRPHEMLPFGHFDGIEVDDNGFPAGAYRHVLQANGGRVYVDSRQVRSGTHSLYIEGTDKRQGNGFGVPTLMTRPLVGGETYKFTLWFRAPEALAKGEGSRIYVRISTGSTDIHWDDSWFESLPLGVKHGYDLSRHLVYIRVYDSAWQDPADPKDWDPISVTFTVPKGMELTGVFNVYNESSESLWIDDLSLQLL